MVHDRQGNEVCTFSDMRNYGWVDLFKGHYLVARNGGCTFKVYDLQQKMCVKTYQVFGRQYSPYGRPVLDKKALIVYEAFLPERILKQKNCLFECGDRGMPVYRFSV